MMIEFPWPQTNGEWLAWSSALMVLILALWMFLMPRWWLLRMKLQNIADHPQVTVQIRGPIAGTYFGLAMAVLLLHPQPLLYLALGSTLFFAALGRLISIFANGSRTAYNWISLTTEGILAFFPLAYVFRWIA